MHVVPVPANILDALIYALEQPHTITERGGDLFIVLPPGATDDSVGHRCLERHAAPVGSMHAISQRAQRES